MATIEKQYAGFWRRQPTVSTSAGWEQLPGIFPAGGDTPSDDHHVIAAALCKRARIKPDDDKSNRIEVQLYDVSTVVNVMLDVSMTTQFKKP